MRGFFRGATIVWVALRYGLDGLVLSSFQKPWIHLLARVLGDVPARVLAEGARWSAQALRQFVGSRANAAAAASAAAPSWSEDRTIP